MWLPPVGPVARCDGGHGALQSHLDGIGTVPLGNRKAAPSGGCRGFKGPCPSTPRDANGYVWPEGYRSGPRIQKGRLSRLDLELAPHPGVDAAEVAVAARDQARRGRRDRVRVAAVDDVVAQRAGIPTA